MRPLLRGWRGAAAARPPLCAEAGLRVLQQGGNAVDAGCAALLAASVIEFSHSSFRRRGADQRLQSSSLERGHPNELEPGKRPRIALNPALVLRSSAPFAAPSAPGECLGGARVHAGAIRCPRRPRL
jgi:gamma-glutamyltranspeptidase